MPLLSLTPNRTRMWLGMPCSLWCHHVMDIVPLELKFLPSSLPSRKSIPYSSVGNATGLNEHFPNRISLSFSCSHSHKDLHFMVILMDNVIFSEEFTPAQFTSGSDRQLWVDVWPFLLFYTQMLLQEQTWTSPHWATSCRALQIQIHWVF